MRLRISVATLRSVVLLLLGGTLLLLTGELWLLLLCAPFAIWTALAVLRRPSGREPAPTSRLGSSRLQTGARTRWVATAPGSGWLLELAVAEGGAWALDPPAGSVVGLEQVQLSLRPHRWGRHVVAGQEGWVGDSWGLWSGLWRPDPATVRVAPERDSPGGGEAIPHPVGLVGIHPSRVRGEGSELAEIRAFQVGDRLRRVNWRVTSRTGQLHTNATTTERDTEVLVVTDTLADLATDLVLPERSPAHASSLDVTVLAAATVAEHYLRLGDRVGLHDLGLVIGSLPPGAGGRQRAVITEQLARASAERVVLGGAVQRIRRVRPGSLVVVCSPLLDAEVVAEVLRLAHRGAAVLVVDTLPAALGASLPRGGGRARRALERFRPPRFWAEAWTLRRLERDVDIRRLETLGVAVVAWRGMESLGAVVAALSLNRTAPRLSRGAGGGR